MDSAIGDFANVERRTATNFLKLIEFTTCRQIVYLSGIANQRELSHHLSSRLAVERILRGGKIPVTVLRAAIIVGSGSASFEIIRDLVEKLPLMVAPKWIHTRCQPIAIRNVIELLTGVILKKSVFDGDIDIGGPEVLTYRDMLYQYAQVRRLRRWIITVPVMTPRLSSYWLYFITSTSYTLAVNLVESMKVDAIARKNHLAENLGIQLIPYKQAVELALEKIEKKNVLSSWKDALGSERFAALSNAVTLPRYGCLQTIQIRDISGEIDAVWEKVWKIGGVTGWYSANWLWKVRGFLDKLVGGVGLNRGRPEREDLRVGDALDFWRVLVADKEQKRLLLFAEMKLPGEAWLEFRVQSAARAVQLVQTAIFRPRGVWGRCYWYGLLPLHQLVFKSMAHALTRPGTKESLATQKSASGNDA